MIFAAGTGNPFFTTDTAAALRAAELGCDAMLKGTKVDGVYSADPMQGRRRAVRYDRLTYHDVLARDLKVMDASAISLARESAIPIIVFSLQPAGRVCCDVLRGEGPHTMISEEAPQATGGCVVSQFNMADLRKRMDGALEVLRKEFAGLRTGPRLRQPARADHGAGLRLGAAAQPGRHGERAGGAHAVGPGLGQGPGQGGREGDPHRSISASTRRSRAI